MIPGRRRRGQRGNATVVVAVAGVALTAATGLAIDGGMAAGAYRHAQNAADAGALAAARQVYLDATMSPPVASTTDNLTPIARKEVEQHNGSQLVSVNGLGLVSSTSTNNTTWVPTSTSGVTGFAALADMTTVVPNTSPATTVHILANDSQANIMMAPTTSGGSQATADAELANASVIIPGQDLSGDFNCSSASAHYTASQDSPGTSSSCSSGTGLSPYVSTAGTLVSTVNPDVNVSAANVPTSEPTVTVANLATIINTLLGVPIDGVSASLVLTTNQLGWPGGVLTATSSTSATNVQVTTPQVNVSASSLTMSLSIATPPGGHPTITATCAPVTLTFTAQPAGTPYSVPINPSCQPQVALPTIPGTTIDMPWVQPGTDYNAACSYNNGSGVWNCSGVQACMLRITIAASDTIMCLGEANISYAATAVNPNTSNSTTLTQFAGGVQVIATLPQTTYFMRVVGIDQTSPTATAQAAPEGVVDESSAAFAASPFGIPADATMMGSPPPGCTPTLGSLSPNCDYYLYGPFMQSYSAAPRMPGSWQGQLDLSSNHHVGQQVLGAALRTMTPQLYQGTSSYYLEPVFDPATLTILYYGVFLPVTGQQNWGQYVTNIPVQADSAPGWTVLQQGAVSIKLEG